MIVANGDLCINLNSIFFLKNIFLIYFIFKEWHRGGNDTCVPEWVLYPLLWPPPHPRALAGAFTLLSISGRQPKIQNLLSYILIITKLFFHQSYFKSKYFILSRASREPNQLKLRFAPFRC